MKYGNYISSFPGKPAMLEKLKAELALRKGVRLGARGGSLGYDPEGVGGGIVSPGMHVTRRMKGFKTVFQHPNRIQSYLLSTIQKRSRNYKNWEMLGSRGGKPAKFEKINL